MMGALGWSRPVFGGRGRAVRIGADPACCARGAKRAEAARGRTLPWGGARPSRGHAELPGATISRPMTDLKLIVTHPGGAHKDDLIATCVLIATHGCPVERRDPTPEELEDAHVAVVDVGGRHDPALHNYDHHQFPREHEPTCALSLVLQRMDLYRERPPVL